MKITVKEQEENKLTFMIHGVGHTFCNALKDTMADMEGVSVVTYTIKHPLVADPKFFLETNEANPKDLLEEAATSLQKENNEFLEAFSSLEM